MLPDETLDCFDRSVEFPNPAYIVMRVSRAFNADLHKSRSEPSQKPSHGVVNKRSVRQDRETEISPVGGQNLKQFRKVFPEQRLAPSDRDVAADGPPRLYSPPFKQVFELLQYVEQFPESEFFSSVRFLVAMGATQVAAFRDVPLEQ
jgi:hypothetical protein